MTSSTYAIFVRDVTLDLTIGIYPHEKGQTQKVGVTLEVEMEETYGPDSFLNYDSLVGFLTQTVPQQAWPLQEHLACHIRDFVMGFEQVRRVQVDVCKPEAYPNALAGVRLTAFRG